MDAANTPQPPMTRDEFFSRLERRLSSLPRAERERVTEYYGELLCDGQESGRDEAELLSGFGSPEDIADKTLAEYKKPGPGAGITALKIVAMVFGLPIAAAILIPLAAAAAVLYLCVWILILCLYIIVLSFALCGLVGIIGAPLILMKNPLAALFQFGAGLLFCGLCLLTLAGSIAATKGFFRASIKLFGGIAAAFRKRRVQHETI